MIPEPFSDGWLSPDLFSLTTNTQSFCNFSLWLGENAGSVSLFILLFHVNSHLFSPFSFPLYPLYSRLSIQLPMFQLVFSVYSHSPLGLQSIVMRFYSLLFSVLQSALHKNDGDVLLIWVNVTSWRSITRPVMYDLELKWSVRGGGGQRREFLLLKLLHSRSS